MNSLREIVSRSFLFLIILLSTISYVFAQDTASDETEPDEIKTLQWTFGMGVNYFLLDKEATAKQMVGDTAFSVNFHASYYFVPKLAVSAGLGFLQLNDKDEFSQQVIATDVTGSEVQTTATSDAKGIHYYGELLYTVTNATSPVQLKAGVGFGSIAAAERSIENCSNCMEMDIDLAGGAYATASVYRGIANDQYNIGLSGKQFFSGDIKNTATLWFEYIF